MCIWGIGIGQSVYCVMTSQIEFRNNFREKLTVDRERTEYDNSVCRWARPVKIFISWIISTCTVYLHDILQAHAPFLSSILIKFTLFLRVKTSAALHRTFNVEPLYLQHENSGKIPTRCTIFIAKFKIETWFARRNTSTTFGWIFSRFTQFIWSWRPLRGY